MMRIKANKNINPGLAEATAITKKFARVFYFASRFLSREKRIAAYAIYAICRVSDDVVDTPRNKLRLQSLEGIKNNIDSVYDGSQLQDGLLSSFREVVNKFHIPKIYFAELLLGMNMDLNKNRYQNFGELNSYCYRVAGVVGLIMLKIFGCTRPEADKYAVDLGIAMQLTNILRDIQEDFNMGRIYLPADEMALYGVSQRHLQEGIIDTSFINLLKFQIKRAREYYKNSEAGIRMIQDLRSRFVVQLIKMLYSEILRVIERNGYDVFSRRVRINNFRKIILVSKALLSFAFN